MTEPIPRELPRPTDSELSILRVLWARGASTVREVMEAMDGERSMGYTTVLKFMQIMLEKGLLLRDDSARTHVYRPAAPPERTRGQMTRHLVERVFEGSVRDLVMGALGDGKVSPEEASEIRALLEVIEYERPS